MLKQIFLCLVLMCSYHGIQPEQFKPWATDKPLTWDDFTGEIDKSSKFDAQTEASINYTYHWIPGPGMFNYEFKVVAKFDHKKSWSFKNRQSPELLAHEQLHFDIAEVYAMKLLIAFNEKKYSANYEQEIKDIFTETMGKVRATQIRYDDETAHFVNKTKQKEWEDSVHVQLNTIARY